MRSTLRNRLIYYSLTLPRDNPRPDLLHQLVSSVHSLRAYNATVPIVLFVYGETPLGAAVNLQRLGVSIWSQGSYEAKLQRLLPRGWEALGRYPLLHKFLNFPEIATLHPDQVLFLDCDTLFSGDVDELFARYADASCCACEEPTCARSSYGYDRENLNEELLCSLAARERLRIPPPFNLGAVLWNQRVWERVQGLDALIVWYAWRFLLSIAMEPVSGRAAEYGESEAGQFLATHFSSLVTAEDLRWALPYPSANRWLLDEVALWFALGHVPGLTYADFSPVDVIQNGEFLSRPPQESDWILCHYYTQNMPRLNQWIRRGEVSGHSAATTGFR